MLKIGKAKKNARLELGGGAYLVYRQATTVDREAGVVAARAFFQSVRAGSAALADYGVDIGDGGLLDSDEALSVGVSSIVSLTEIGMRCISEWSGVGDDSGPAPLTRRNLADLLHDPVYYDIVSQALLSRLCMIDAEGKDSAPSQNGAAAGAPTTACPAAN